jgi:RNHCP domain
LHTTRKKYGCSTEQRRDHTRFSRRHRHTRSTDEVFKCRHCRRFIGPLPYGGHHRNHCPFCLYSRHVDGRQTGDRSSDCGARMEPVGYFQRPNGEYVLVHRCLGCDFERFNRIAADDNFDLLLSLPALSPRTSREMKLEQLQKMLLEEQQELD